MSTSNSTLKNRIEETLKEFPFLLGDSIGFTLSHFQINPIDIPDFERFNKSQGNNHCSKFKKLNNTQLAVIFKRLEEELKKPTVYIYWVENEEDVAKTLKKYEKNHNSYIIEKGEKKIKTIPALNKKNTKLTHNNILTIPVVRLTS